MRAGVVFEAPVRCTLCDEEFRPIERRVRVPSPSGKQGWAHDGCAREFYAPGRHDDENAGTACRMDTCGACGRCS